MSDLSRWSVYANEGYKKRKERRIVQAHTASEAMTLAKHARGWGHEVRVTAKYLGPVMEEDR